jgi:hypothetical protein
VIQTTLETIIRTAKDVVAESPDYTYEYPAHLPRAESINSMSYCMYVHGDKPGCIVGHIMNRLGVSLDTLDVEEHNGARAVFKRHFKIADGVEFQEAASFLEVLQNQQDGASSAGAERATWADALAHALTFVPAGVGA